MRSHGEWPWPWSLPSTFVTRESLANPWSMAMEVGLVSSLYSDVQEIGTCGGGVLSYFSFEAEIYLHVLLPKLIVTCSIRLAAVQLPLPPPPPSISLSACVGVRVIQPLPH